MFMCVIRLSQQKRMLILFFLLLGALPSSLFLLRVLSFLSGSSALAAATERRVAREINRLIGVSSDHEGRNRDEVLADLDVALADEQSRVVDGAREARFLDLRLQSAFHELLDREPEDVVELVFGLAEEAVSVHAAQNGLALEQSAGVLRLQRQQLSRSLAQTREHELNSPNLTLVLQSVFTDNLHLIVQALLLEGATRRLVRRRLISIVLSHSAVSCRYICF